MIIKHITKLGTAILLAVLVFSCGKETQTTTQGGGLFKIRYTITPALENGGTFLNSSRFNAPCLSPGFEVMLVQWYGYTASKALSTIETNEYSVTKGQNISIPGITCYNELNLICRTVKIEGIINGKVFQTLTKELGMLSTSPAVYCKDQTSPGFNFIIP